MIDYQEYKEWEMDDSSDRFQMIAVGYDPEMKQHFIDINGFDLSNKISDKKEFVELILRVIHNNDIGNEYQVRLKNDKFPWFSDWMKQKDTSSNDIINYLNGLSWPKKKYFGEFDIMDLGSFLYIFIDYPTRFEYQDIELFAKETDTALVISSHANVWIISGDELMLRTMALQFENEGATVFPSRFLES